jgi:hypothetical protein
MSVPSASRTVGHGSPSGEQKREIHCPWSCLALTRTSSPTRPPPSAPGPTSSWHPPSPGQSVRVSAAAEMGPTVPAAALGGRERPRTGLSPHPVAVGSWGDCPGRAHHGHRAGPGAVGWAWPQDRRPGCGRRGWHRDAAQLQPEDATVVLAVLEERRSNLVGQRTPASTSSMRCCASSSRAAPHPSCAPTGPPHCCAVFVH